jgi:hypothetical protein
MMVADSDNLAVCLTNLLLAIQTLDLMDVVIELTMFD